MTLRTRQSSANSLLSSRKYRVMLVPRLGLGRASIENSDSPRDSQSTPPSGGEPALRVCTSTRCATIKDE